MEPETTTVDGPKMWIIVGILGITGTLLLIGLAIPDSRTYIIDGVKVLLGSISSVATLK